jgi:hypothetical protein
VEQVITLTGMLASLQAASKSAESTPPLKARAGAGNACRNFINLSSLYLMEVFMETPYGKIILAFFKL